MAHCRQQERWGWCYMRTWMQFWRKKRWKKNCMNIQAFLDSSLHWSHCCICICLYIVCLRYTGWATIEQRPQHTLGVKICTPPTFCYNFVKYWLIFKILSLAFSRKLEWSLDSTTPQMRRYTTLWIINVRKLACPVHCGSLAEGWTRQNPDVRQAATTILHKT